MRNALSIDVEEYFQVSNFEGKIPPDQWETYPSRVVQSTDKLLAILDSHAVKATFFVLGWNAERWPDLVRRIADSGHEVACHGHRHRLVYDCSPEEFRHDVASSRRLLGEIVGLPVIGYRAPSFSITPRSAWALPILAEEGYLYDSSVFPVSHPRYGWSGAERYPHLRDLGNGRRLWEFPLMTAPVLGMRLPAAGGGYLRLFPLALVRRGIRAANRDGRPGIVYLHPWELDPEQPRIPVGRMTRIRHYGGLRGTERKLRRLLREFSFGPLREVLKLEAR